MIDTLPSCISSLQCWREIEPLGNTTSFFRGSTEREQTAIQLKFGYQTTSVIFNYTTNTDHLIRSQSFTRRDLDYFITITNRLLEPCRRQHRLNHHHTVKRTA